MVLIEKGQKPWFLTSAEVYKIVKHAVLAIPKSEVVFDKLLQGIAALTKFINDATRANIVFEPNQCYELITKLDEILSEQLVVVDDGFDALRNRLCSNLRLLIVSLIRHKEWAESYITDAPENAKLALTTRYETALALLALLTSKLEERFPKASKLATTTVDTVKITVENGKSIYQNGFDWNLYLQKALVLAQPYVQSAVVYGLPYAEKVKDISYPYYEKAAPFIAPVVAKTETALKENKYVGDYVTKAIDTSAVIIEEVKSYALPTAEVH